MADNATYYYGTGRRKNAIARVRLYPGEGNIMVNNKPSLQYFGRRMLEMVVVEPLKLTESQKRFSVSAMVNGGGMVRLEWVISRSNSPSPMIRVIAASQASRRTVSAGTVPPHSS